MEGYVKVLFPITPDDGDSETTAETMWAVPLGPNHFRLDNIPFYVFGVSDRDVVEAEIADDAPMFTFRRVVEKSGHRTIRVRVYDPAQKDIAREELKKFGCESEGLNARTFSIDVPPTADFDGLLAWVRDGAERDRWDYEEADI